MPDFDNGHIFLTTLAPIKPGAPADDPQVSHGQRIRTGLSLMPVARQSPATANAHAISPFARNTRNHLARMFVLNDTVYNGRNTMNPLAAIFRSIPVIRNFFGGGVPADVLKPQKVDHLNASYLVFCADIDAITDDGDPLPANLNADQQREVRHSYARKLWETMSEELTALYSNCYGFEGVDSADKFAAYLDRCHVETTMPFHDYYFQNPGFKNSRLMIGLGAVTALTFAAAIVGFALHMFGLATIPFTSWPTNLFWPGATLLGLVLGFITVKFINSRGQKPFPLGRFDDLPSVLKAIYIQQKLADFYIDNQGADPDALHAAFGKFIAEHDPQNTHSKTQKPGVISSADPQNVTP